VDLRKAVAKLGAIAELSAKDQDLVVLLVNKFINMLGEWLYLMIPVSRRI